MTRVTLSVIRNGLSGALLLVAISVRRVVVFFGVVLNFGIGIQDFAFKGKITEYPLEVIVGEC